MAATPRFIHSGYLDGRPDLDISQRPGCLGEYCENRRADGADLEPTITCPTARRSRPPDHLPPFALRETLVQRVGRIV